MPVTPDSIVQVDAIVLPAVHNIRESVGPIVVEQLAIPVEKVSCQAAVLDTSRGVVNRLSIQFLGNDNGMLLLNRRTRPDLFERSAFVIDDPNFVIDEQTIITSSSASWVAHPKLLGLDSERVQEAVSQSWISGVTYNEERRNPDGDVTSLGMRSPQIGALHAISAHWSVSGKPGLVVMPTGTGKTEVMLACLVMKRPKRLLVLVPSDALRTQTVTKFVTLGKLRDLGVVEPEILNPVVGRIKGSVNDVEHLAALEKCNVVVSTVASLAAMPPNIAQRFRKLFDVIYFDEAHHTPSNSWETLLELFEGRLVLLFTATPFREDGRRIPGRIIYNFPLRLAQAQGLFKKIDFREVFQPDAELADESIAEAAVSSLRADIAANYDHILLARTDTKDNALRIFEIYQSRFSDLNPVVIFSGISGFREKMQAIVSRSHRIVVCVDMFGEGFDLPNLKIAALHSPHKSLAVTLQFCGRFTREAKNLGNATLVANIADPKVSDAIEELYAEDSDWNTLIPELSSRAIESQVNFSDFLDRMERSDKGDSELFDLNVLRPKTSTVIFKAHHFTPHSFRKGLKKSVEVERVWISKDKDLLVFITRSRVPIEWASIKETSNMIWDLYVVAFDVESKLLYINSSQKGSLFQDLARSISGKDVKLLEGESMFRAYSGVNRLIFHNAGLYRRGAKLRFRMYTGLDIAEAISPIAQIGSSKSNLFGVGYSNGKKVTVGVSHKGRVWSMSSSSVPDWRVWCSSIAQRITDESIATDDYLRHTLIPKEISNLPQQDFLTVVLPVEMYASGAQDFRLFAAGTERNFHDFGIFKHEQKSTSEVQISVGFNDDDSFVFRLQWGPDSGRFEVSQIRGDTIEIQQGTQRISLAEFFQVSPPALFAIDGSEVRGASYLEAKKELEFTFAPSAIVVGPWEGIDITKESKWKNGVRRNDTVQAAWIAELLNSSNRFVIDDDDTGEAADIIEIREDQETVAFHLYHCKYAGGADSGRRVKDCYEVCGQAVRSVRWVDNPLRLLDHIQQREKPASLGGRPTRFEKGTLRELVSLRKRARKLRTDFAISIVQPGISKAKIPEDIAAILGAADAFIRDFTGKPLGVIGGE